MKVLFVSLLLNCILSLNATAREVERCNGTLLDAKSFRQLGVGFFKDKSRVCYRGHQLEGLDPRSVQVMNGAIATDGRALFVRSQRIAGADITSFKYLGYRYYKDSRHVYQREDRQLIRLQGFDAKTFKLHGAYYVSDKRGVYWNGFRVMAADPQTFQITGLQTGKDNHRTFNKGVAIANN